MPKTREDFDTDRDFLVAATAASIDEQRGAWERPVHQYVSRLGKVSRRLAAVHEQFTRGHLTELHAAGATRDEVRSYLESLEFMNPQQIALVMADLGSYGEGQWHGD